MKKSFLAICFVVAIFASYAADSVNTARPEISTKVSSDDYKYIYVNLDVFDAKTGEFRRTDKNIKVRISNGVYEINFIYGWRKCSRSNKRGYNYYYNDGVNAYYF